MARLDTCGRARPRVALQRALAGVTGDRAGRLPRHVPHASTPTPCKSLGFTWPSGWPTFQHLAKYSDRIDIVWAGGPAKALRSQIVGYPGSPYTDIPVKNWVSDHRAVVSTVRVHPVKPPTLVAVDSFRVTRGDSIGVSFHAPGRDGVRVELRHGGVTVASRSTDGAHNGHVQFSSAALAPGIYAVSLAGTGGQAPTPTSVTVVARRRPALDRGQEAGVCGGRADRE